MHKKNQKLPLPAQGGKKRGTPPAGQRGLSRDARENLQLYSILLPTAILIIVFMYAPMFGLVIGFQNYVPGASFFGKDVEWVGLKHFIDFVNSYYFKRIMRNTVILNLLNLVMGFWVPIVFALLLNEVRARGFKKFVQTASYLPYFISSVVVAGMVISFTGSDGIVSRLISALGGETAAWITKADAFPWIFTITRVWQSFGWSSILYLSTISSIDPGLYEAAEMDGANRFHKIWHVTIPHMLPLVIIQLILAIGSMLSVSSELILLLYNPSTRSTADVIGTYVYREGLLAGNFSSGTAAGLIVSLINLGLTVIANAFCRKFTDYALW